jgi:hypothetical protein
MTEPTLRVLSLGAGVQSTTLALMAAEGLLPRPDAAVFADTGWEPPTVYRHLDRLAVVLADAGIPLYRVARGDLRADALDPEHRFASVPYFVRKADGTLGMGRRQCTHEYKLRPVRRKIRELLGAPVPHFRRVRGRVVAEQWIGFDINEVGRINDSGQPRYLTSRYPLMELGMSRKDCTRWLAVRGWRSVAKSACVGCPFHGNVQWRAMRDTDPEAWADAVAFDRAIRNGGGNPLPLGAQAFLHRSCVPLDEAPIDRVSAREWAARQTDLLDAIADLEAGLEEGEPGGCSPHGCRSGRAVVA